MTVRLIDLNEVSYLHSQTLYHAVAYCTTETSSGTVILLKPREPYVCVGFHQFLEKDVDVGYCRKKGLPIVRREVGGGTVYLDRDQLFFQCIFPKNKAPKRVDDLYQLFLKPAVNTYRRLGLGAGYGPLNDIQVDGKKICGTGAGRIGDAAVVVGNIIFDFDYKEMCRVLRLPSEPFRRMVYDSMKMYLTNLRKELSYRPNEQRVRAILMEEFQRVLGVTFRKANLAPGERTTLIRLDKRFEDPEWLYQNCGMSNSSVKICSDVSVKETSVQSPAGRITILLRLKGDAIDGITISGDLSSGLQENIAGLERSLVGEQLEFQKLLKAVKTFCKREGIESKKGRAEDIAGAIMLAKS